MRRTSKRRVGNRFDHDGDVNPMDYVGNMSDAMLILAVGIMLALIVHWNVDVSVATSSKDGNAMEMNGKYQIDKENAVNFDEKDMQEVDDSEDMNAGSGMDKLGQVFYDESTGKYYIVKEK